MAEMSLVYIAPPRTEQRPLFAPIDPARGQQAAGIHRGRYAETVEHDLADAVRPVGGEQARLESDETDGGGGAYGIPQHHPTVGIKPRRDIDRQAGCGVRIDRRDGLGPVSGDRAVEPCAQQRIDDQVDGLRYPGERSPVAARLLPARGIDGRIAAQPLTIAQLQYRHTQARLPRQTRNDEPVAGVVAGAGKHRDTARLRPSTAQQIEGGAPGALHQLKARNRELLDRQAIEATHLFAGIERARQVVGGGEGSKLHRHPGSLSVYLIYTMEPQSTIDFNQLALNIKAWGKALGFQKVGITDTDLHDAERHLDHWLGNGFHGEMAFMHQHGSKRTRPAELVPGTVRIISVRMDYLPDETDPAAILDDPSRAFVSRYALGRDYHKLLRKRLQRLADLIVAEAGPFGYRAFVDSAPVMEKAIAQKAGLGWIGKHSNLLDRTAGSWFFLGELYTDLPLPVDHPVTDHCGNCRACIDCCPTQAIVAPYQVDARLCISYLTIELKGAIPHALRSLLGNRIYGCDDCQQVCPWNRFATATPEQDFMPRHGLDTATLCELFAWDEDTFLARTQGSAIRRIGYQRWLRNIAVALGNATSSASAVAALQARRDIDDPLVGEHIEWALRRHEGHS